jgi:hypothetical protein
MATISFPAQSDRGPGMITACPSQLITTMKITRKIGHNFLRPGEGGEFGSLMVSLTAEG